MPNKEPFKIIQSAEGKTLLVSYEHSPHSASLENDPVVMANTINLLLDAGPVDEISFLQKEEYIYDAPQVKLIQQIVELLIELTRRKNILDYSNVKSPSCTKNHPERLDLLRAILLYELREDPIGAYLDLAEKIKTEETKSLLPGEPADCKQIFINTLKFIQQSLEKTDIIKLAQPYIKEYSPDSRAIYQRFFKPIMRPSFTAVKLASAFPTNAEEVDSYRLDDGSHVLILRTPDEIRPIYHISPPEFKLSEEKYRLLGEAKAIVAEHRPQRSEFVDPERTRDIFKSVEKDLITDLAKAKGIKLTYNDIDLLGEILVRNTIGFGILEVLLSDQNIQDVAVNAPVGVAPLTVIHATYGECLTNIIITPRETDSWATKLRMISGRPLDEANPVLDTDLLVPGGRARVAAIQQPLSPKGLAYSFRRHRAKPWTLPLFIQNKMINPLAAGLLSFIIDGARTLLIAGTRSAGKTSFLGSLMVEIMRANRIICVEDTLELPTTELKKLGYDLQSMKVQSVITGERAEVEPAAGVRTSLRMGDSCLIYGEVRSKEAIALYEAMRVGALANVVAGTIHGDSPYGVFDRVVNDLGVPTTSFKATDIIIVCNPIKSASGLEVNKRVVQISEVRKDWTEDPVRERGFVDLMVYNPLTDQLEPTPALIEGESEILKAIAGRVREWAGNWDAVWQNIQLRTRLKETLVKFADEYHKPEILEAEFVVAANDKFHKLSELVAQETGKTDPEKIYREWEEWVKEKISSLAE